MKKKIGILLALTLFFTTVAAFVMTGSTKVEAALAVQKVNNTDATVTCNKLNIRQGPSTKHSVVGTAKKGQILKVLSKVGNWYAVYDPKNGRIGACDGKYLKMAVPATANVTDTPAKDKQKTETTVAPSDISKDEQALLGLVNKARKSAGVKEVAFDKELLKVARLKAKDMADKSYFSHQSPTYGSPFDMMKQYRVSFKSAGENIAGNQTIEGAFKAWMNSDGHKKNILNADFNFTGIGISESKTYGKILVQQFIGR